MARALCVKRCQWLCRDTVAWYRRNLVKITLIFGTATSSGPCLQGQGITCNAICPGYVLTPLFDAQIPDQIKVHDTDRETVVRKVMLLRPPSRQFATAEQIGGTTVYLCPSAGDHVTGTAISVDGGWTAL